MIKIKYNDSNIFEEVTFNRVGNLVTITPTKPNTSGFTTYRMSCEQLGDFSDYNTIYKVEGNSVTYSNDGSVYKETPQPTEEELKEQNILNEISTLKQELAKTDYQAIKYAEGWFTDEEYAPIKAMREEIREKIRYLESQLEN